MYTVGSVLPVEGIPPGSTLLVVGLPMTGKRALTLELLAAGFDEESAAVVSTDSSATDIRTSSARYTDTPADQPPLGVVDCVGDAYDRESLGPLDSRVSSPADLTGIGMELTTLIERLYADSSRLRVGVLSLTTMSMYAASEQVVRFLHVVSSRIREADGVGFVVYDGRGDPDRSAALLARALDDNTCSGFWTYEHDIVGRLDGYIAATYLDTMPSDPAVD